MKKCEKFSTNFTLEKVAKKRDLEDVFTYSQALILILKNTKNKRKQK